MQAARDDAERLLLALTEDQRSAAAASLADPRRRAWSYLPGDRPGLKIGDLTPHQRGLLDRLVESTLESTGGEIVRGAMEMERLRRQIVGGSPVADDRYWIQVWDDPGAGSPWGWRINGHHLGVHVVFAGDEVTTTPHFIGAEPAVVPSGPDAGFRPLGPEEDLARELLAQLDPDQRATAVTSPVAPDDILTRHDPVAVPDALPTGLSRAAMSGSQRAALKRLVARYLHRLPRRFATEMGQDLESTDDAAVTFAWQGPVESYGGHYYCVRTPGLIIEYDNTQDGANHAHSVIRHSRRDWGDDLLRRHYSLHH